MVPQLPINIFWGSAVGAKVIGTGVSRVTDPVIGIVTVAFDVGVIVPVLLVGTGVTDAVADGINKVGEFWVGVSVTVSVLVEVVMTGILVGRKVGTWFPRIAKGKLQAAETTPKIVAIKRICLSFIDICCSLAIIIPKALFYNNIYYTDKVTL